MPVYYIHQPSLSVYYQLLPAWQTQGGQVDNAKSQNNSVNQKLTWFAFRETLLSDHILDNTYKFKAVLISSEKQNLTKQKCE